MSALAGVRLAVSYEGQAAIELETLSAAATCAAMPYAVALDGDIGAAAAGPRMGAADWVGARAAGSGVLSPRPAVVRLAPLMGAILDDLESGAAPGAVGARFHATVAALVLRELPPGPCCDRPGDCRAGRRCLPEPAACRALRETPES